MVSDEGVLVSVELFCVLDWFSCGVKGVTSGFNGFFSLLRSTIFSL